MSDATTVRPEVSSSADVTLVARGLTVTARVEVSDEYVIAVRPGGEGTAWKTSVKPGDAVEVYWVAGYEERTLPARITGVEEAADGVVWTLAATGPAERSQRRRSVRARVELPVSLPWAGGLLSGNTIDLSEAGMRAVVDGWGLPPDVGTATEVTITLEDRAMHLHGEVMRQSVTGSRWALSLRFVGMTENDEDVLRRRVFQALRDERARQD